MSMFSKMGDMKKMYDKYKQLEKVLKNLVIRAKEGKYDDNGEEKDAIIVDISGEMKIKDLNVYQNGKFIGPHNVEAENGFITSITPSNTADPKGFLTPGYIDIHSHGANGRDSMEGTPEAFDAISKWAFTDQYSEVRKNREN